MTTTNKYQIKEALADLAALLGSAGYLDESDVRERHSRDSSTANACMPLAVLRPVDTQQVSAIMRICHHAGMPVVPQGGLTGLSGGAVPSPGSVALSLERMKGVIEVDAQNASLTVWAGTALETVQEAAFMAAFEYPVDIGARGSATIGGMIATNAGGIRVLRHGMTRNHVLGLEVVLADGTIISNLRSMLKDNAGFDLKQLFIGSEGCLGIITRAVLRLSPAAHGQQTVILGLPSYKSALECLASARQVFQADLTAFEGMWPAYWNIANKMVTASRRPIASDQALYVLMEVSSQDSEQLHAWLETCFAAELIADGAIATSLTHATAMWAIREAIGEIGRETGGHLNFDVGLAPSRLGDFVEACELVLKDVVDSEIFHLGHIADGNLHVIVPVPPGNHDIELEIERRLFDLLAGQDGTITAEHGIGTLKRPWIGKTRSPQEIQLMQVLKTAIDPKGLLNPGKVILEHAL